MATVFERVAAKRIPVSAVFAFGVEHGQGKAFVDETICDRCRQLSDRCSILVVVTGANGNLYHETNRNRRRAIGNRQSAENMRGKIEAGQ